MERMREDLERQRELLKAALEAAEAKELAGLSRELRQVNEALDGLAPPERSRSDELAEKRRRRRSGVQDEATGGVVGG